MNQHVRGPLPYTTAYAVCGRKVPKSLRLCFGFSLCAMLGVAAIRADTPRLPVPGEDAQKAAVDLIKDVFSSDYAVRSPEGRRALATKMLAQVAETDEAASQFVLLSEARAMAAAGGDIGRALDACDELTKRFDVSAPRERTATLDLLVPSAKTPEAARELSNEAVATLEHAVKLGDFEAALQCAAIAEKTGIKAKDIAALAAIRKRKAELGDLRKAFEQYTQSEGVLKAKPDDAEANLVTGKYLCFVQDSWDSGLRRLAKGSDAGLAALAQASLLNPSQAAEQSVLANQWWEFAESLEGAERDGARAYAGHWYQAAVGQLSGLSKSLAEKRLAELTKTVAAKRGRQQIDLLELIDLKQDVVFGEWKMDDGGLQCTRGGLVPKVRIPLELPKEYDVSFVFSQPAFRNGLGVILPNRNGGMFCVYLLENGVGYGFSVNGRTGRHNRENREYPGAAKPNTKYRVLVQVREKGAKLLVDGKVVASYEGDFAALKSDMWRTLKDGHQFAVFCDDPTTFESLELLEVSGQGKKLR